MFSASIAASWLRVHTTKQKLRCAVGSVAIFVQVSPQISICESFALPPLRMEAVPPDGANDGPPSFDSYDDEHAPAISSQGRPKNHKSIGSCHCTPRKSMWAK